MNEPASRAERTRDAVLALVGRLHPDRFGTGPLAEIRRMRPMAAPLPPAAWKLLLEHVPDELRRDESEERAWALVIAGMAQMAPAAHAKDARAGRALAETGYSEMRFLRLLRAEGDAATGHVLTACRWLAGKGRAVDWVRFAPFVLTRAAPRLGDAEREAHALARDFFAALNKTDTPATTETEGHADAR